MKPSSTSARPLCLIKAGSTYPENIAETGDFEDWLIAGLGLPEDAVCVLDAREVAELPPPGECAGVLIGGAHAMITDEMPWMKRLADWTARVVAAQVPFLGICFGHQMLARAMGGRVDFHPQGREIGSVPIELHPAAETDPLFADMPTRFRAHAVHAQSVVTLPPGAELLAGNSFEATHAFRVGGCAWGVQFHPEFNPARMSVYLDHFAPTLHAVGQDAASIRAGLVATPESASLLPRFARLARAELCD
jgi:GMP synthase (glutamine-hydrolysing)